MVRQHYAVAAILLILMPALAGCSGAPLVGQKAEAQPAPESTAAPAPFAEVAASSPGEAADRARREQRNGDLVAARRDYREALAAGGAPDLLLPLGQVEMALGDAAAAREEWRRLLAANPGEPLRSRARLLLATAELALGDGQAVLRGVDAAMAPDGLADLVILRRAEAAAGLGNADGAAGELQRPELLGSTNRIVLEQAGRVAEQVGRPLLAGRLFVRAASYPAWTADRSRLIASAASAFQESGARDEAIEQYQALLEQYGWTVAGERAGAELESLGGLTPYHRGLLALLSGESEEAREAFAEAAAGGEYAAAAVRQLRQMEEREAWSEAVDVGRTAAFRSFYGQYPDSPLAPEARFQEGFAYFEAERTEEALSAWDRAVAGAVGDDRARLLLWTGKALQRLGREADARARLQAAAEAHPTGYYALRARDLLDEWRGWPRGEGAGRGSAALERMEAERWLAGWAGPADGANVTADARVRRGIGLLALGLTEEADAEFNGLIAESRDGWFLFHLAGMLSEQELWFPATRAATQLVGLSPARTVTEAPPAIQRLVYPQAYPDLVGSEAKRGGIDPLLLLSLAYQESRFDPFALSLANARGLTQVIPPTGWGIASALGRTGFSPDDLYRPTVAVEFGAWYLANQLATFGGDPFRALAAYNAGAGPVPRWAADDPDLFVERIDYSETRSFVRQIYLHHALYRSLQ